MDTIILLLLKYLPQQIEAIKLLRDVPAAVDTIKHLIALVNRTIVILKEAPLDKAGKIELDRIINEDWKTQSFWQPDERPGKPE